MKSICICDDEEQILKYLSKLLKARGYDVVTFSESESLIRSLSIKSSVKYDVFLLDVRMPGNNGISVLKMIKKSNPDTPVVMMTAHGTIDDAVHAMKIGAYDYITKPFPKEKLLGLLERLFDHRRLAEENRLLKEGMSHKVNPDSIIFRSASFREIYDLTLQVAESDANILITGESGTGKELIAKALHKNSFRSIKPFVSINCAALADTLIESQLFGHLKGAFTGAVMNQKGLLEEADSGSLFLDEIGDISPALQAKLLRVIQQKEFLPVGSTRSKNVDVRFIAATNRDLSKRVKEGLFREDLFYRLNVINISLPPLRERKEDIKPLAEHFLKVFCSKIGKKISEISAEALLKLEDYSWAGNVRELQNVMERAVILAKGEKLTADLFTLVNSEPLEANKIVNLLAPLEHVEKSHIQSILMQTGFNKSRSSEILGISRKTLDRKILEYAITRRHSS